MTYDDLLELAHRLEGRRLRTITGKGLAVGVDVTRNASYFVGMLIAPQARLRP